jgi:hypothetical protein
MLGARQERDCFDLNQSIDYSIMSGCQNDPRGLEIIWYGYVLATLIIVYLRVDFLFAAIGPVWGKIAEIDSLLFALLHLALVRIVLELALKFLVGASGSERSNG